MWGCSGSGSGSSTSVIQQYICVLVVLVVGAYVCGRNMFVVVNMFGSSETLGIPVYVW